MSSKLENIFDVIGDIQRKDLQICKDFETCPYPFHLRSKENLNTYVQAFHELQLIHKILESSCAYDEYYEFVYGKGGELKIEESND